MWSLTCGRPARRRRTLSSSRASGTGPCWPASTSQTWTELSNKAVANVRPSGDKVDSTDQGLVFDRDPCTASCDIPDLDGPVFRYGRQRAAVRREGRNIDWAPMREQAPAAGHDVRDPGCLVEGGYQRATVRGQRSGSDRVWLPELDIFVARCDIPDARRIVECHRYQRAAIKREGNGPDLALRSLVAEDVYDLARCRHPIYGLSCRLTPSPVCVRPVNKRRP